VVLFISVLAIGSSILLEVLDILALKQRHLPLCPVSKFGVGMSSVTETRDPKCLARSACRYLQPIINRHLRIYDNSLPTEKSNDRESGLKVYLLNAPTI
jgi:hypothetical protein